MARARKSHKADEENMNTQPGRMKPAYSAKCDGHHYVIYASMQKEADKHPRVLVLKFLATYAAKFFVKQLIADNKIEHGKWMDRDVTITAGDVFIRAANDDLKEIMNYDYQSEAEATWRDPQVERSVAYFKTRSTEVYRNYTEGDNGTGGDDSSDTERGGNRKVSSPVARDKPIKREKSARVSKPGGDFISANQIADELGFAGRDVRGVLRTLKIVKPDHGWSWPKDEADAIKKRVIAGLKKKG